MRTSWFSFNASKKKYFKEKDEKTLTVINSNEERSIEQRMIAYVKGRENAIINDVCNLLDIDGNFYKEVNEAIATFSINRIIHMYCEPNSQFKPDSFLSKAEKYKIEYMVADDLYRIMETIRKSLHNDTFISPLSAGSV